MSSLNRLLRRTFSTLIANNPPPQPSTRSPFNDIYRERNLKRVVEKFKKQSENDRFRTKTGLYENVVRRLATAKRFRWIEEILEDQKQYPDIRKEGFAARLISLYGKAGLFDRASKTFDEMPERNCDRTVKSFNALLGACLNSRKFDKVDGLFRELPEKLSVKPDVVSYNTVIKAFCEMGSLDSAMGMVNEMENNGLNPDLITFNTLLDALYRKNQFVDGEKFWAQMEQKNVVPNILSYNARLDGLINEKKVTEAVNLVESLSSKGLKPDIFTYNALIKGYCHEGNIEESKRLYEDLGKNGRAPDATTFATLLPFACEKGDFDWVSKLYKEIFNKKCIVSQPLLQKTLDCLIRESKIEDAKQLLQLGNSNSYFCYHLNPRGLSS